MEEIAKTTNKAWTADWKKYFIIVTFTEFNNLPWLCKRNCVFFRQFRANERCYRVQGHGEYKLFS